MLINVQGAPVYVFEHGVGEPILFLHGNPESADMWKPIIALLSQRYRCIAPDLPGFGRSGVPDAFDCSLEAMAAWVEALVETLGIEGRITLVCHDFGGPYGLAWAVRHSRRVQRIVAINTLFHSAYRWHFWGKVWRTPVLGELSQYFMTRELFVREMRKGSEGLTETYLNSVYAMITPKMKKMVLKLYRAAHPELFAPWEALLRDVVVRTPTLVLWGDRDPYIASHFADSMGTSNVKHFADYGHFLPSEAPAAVANEIASFCAGSA